MDCVLLLINGKHQQRRTETCHSDRQRMMGAELAFCFR